MASRQLTIASFRAEENEEEELSRLLSRYPCRRIVVSTPAEILEQLPVLEQGVDAAVIPHRLISGGSALSTCLQLKAIPELAGIPTLALSNSKDKAVVEALYGAGADMLMFQPLDPNYLHYQLEALSRRKRSYDEELRRSRESRGLTHSTIYALNSTREGMLITNAECEAIFLNKAASMLLGLDKLKEDQNADAVIDQFEPTIREFRLRNRAAQTTGPEAPRAYAELSITRLDGRSFKAAVRVVELHGEVGECTGYAVSLSDLSELQLLANSMLQAERTRSICLMLAAGCKTLSGSEPLGTPTAPFSYLQNKLDAEPQQCDLNATLTTLLEIIDPVISPNVSIKIDIPNELLIAVRRSELLTLAGHLILHAIEFAGFSGETEISAEPTDETPGRVKFLVTSDSKRVTPPISHDLLADLIAGNFSRFIPGDGSSDKVFFGLQAAQAIGDKYKIYVEMKQVSETRLKIRAKLPLVT